MAVGAVKEITGSIPDILSKCEEKAGFFIRKDGLINIVNCSSTKFTFSSYDKGDNVQVKSYENLEIHPNDENKLEGSAGWVVGGNN